MVPRRKPRRPRASTRPRRKTRSALGRYKKRGPLRRYRRKGGPLKLNTTAGKLTESLCSVRTRMRPMPGVAAAIKRVGSSNFYLSTSSLAVGADQGKQGALSWGNITLGDLKNLRLYISATTAVPSRYVLESVQSEYVMTNCGTNTIQAIIYDITAKRDILAAWNYNMPPGGSITNTVLPIPEAYWANGLLQQSANSINIDNLATTPFDSQLFKQFFTVTKRTILTMTQGATHRHVVLQKPNYVVNDAMVAQYAEVEGIAGLSSYVMVVVQGFPSNNQDSINAITTQLARLTTVASRRFKYTWAQDFTTNTFADNGLASQTGVPKNLNIGSGAIDTVALFT